MKTPKPKVRTKPAPEVKTPNPGRTPDVDFAARVETVLEMLVDGDERAAILRYVSEKWRVTTRTGDKYIAAANAKLEEAAKPHREREIGKAIRRYSKLYRKMNRLQDFKGALAAQSALSSFLGIEASKSLEIRLPDLKNLTDEELVAAREKLKRLRDSTKGH